MESAQALTKPASASLTTSSAAAKSRSISVNTSTKRRLTLLPFFKSYSTSLRKKPGKANPGYSPTCVDSSQYKIVGTGLPLQ